MNSAVQMKVMKGSL